MTMFGFGKKTVQEFPKAGSPAKNDMPTELEVDTTDTEPEQAAYMMVLKGIERQRKLSRTYLILLMLTIPLITAITVFYTFSVYAIQKANAPKYFAFTPDLKIMPLQPLSHPLVSDDTVGNWAARVARKALNLSFSHWREDLLESRKYFTEKAFHKFADDLVNKEGIIPYIKAKRYNIVATLQTPGFVTKKGEVNGIYMWVVEFKLIISYEGGSGVAATSRYVATAIVQRASVLEYPEGLLIRQLVLKRDTGV